MCTVFVAVECVPGYPLVVLANRDEDYRRATASLHEWNDTPGLYAGKDLLWGGTWGGVRAVSGALPRLAFVTNIRQAGVAAQGYTSRGVLVKDYLSSDISPEVFLESLKPHAEEYGPFNLLFGEGRTLFHFSSQSDEVKTLDRGVHGLSNATLNTPWPKVKKGRAFLEAELADSLDLEQSCQRLMYDSSRAADEDLPSTGVSLERERELSSIFIRTPGYGTRSTTLVTVAEDSSGRIVEWTHDESQDATANRIFFSWE